jgi:rhodanese-related sulfurtransferase
MFWGGEQLERIFGGSDPKAAPRWRYAAAAGTVVLAYGVLAIGQPTAADLWARIADQKEAELAERQVQVHPGEVLDLTYDSAVRVELLDVRTETDYNYFHIIDAQHVPLTEVDEVVPDLQAKPDNTVFVVMSNDELAATEAWKTLISHSVPNVYILGGGVNTWVDTFDAQALRAESAASVEDDTLDHLFDAALGSRHPAAKPNPHAYELEYEPKVELQIQRGPIGSGCGS